MNAPTLLDSLREAQTLDEDKPGINPPTPITAEEEWSWKWSPDNSDIVIAHQPAIGVYRNGWGPSRHQTGTQLGRRGRHNRPYRSREPRTINTCPLGLRKEGPKE